MLDCIDNGADLLRGGARYTRGPGTLGIGVADGVNSLAAVKKLVYDEKRLTMDELREALRADFEGYEEVRDLCASRRPSTATTTTTVDQYVRHFAHFVVTEHDKYTTLTGGKMMPSWYPVSSNVPQGMTVAALPSGRQGRQAPGGRRLAQPGDGPARADRRAALGRQVPARGPRRRHAAQRQVRAAGPRRRRGPAALRRLPARVPRPAHLPRPVQRGEGGDAALRAGAAGRVPLAAGARRRLLAPSSWSCTRTSRTTSSRARPTPRSDAGAGGPA